MPKICRLSEKFFNDHPENIFPEIEKKPARPYIIMLVQIENNCFAVPFRTYIKHGNSYRFTDSPRATAGSAAAPGIDFSKAVIVNDEEYIGRNTSINNAEYRMLCKKEHFIEQKFRGYVEKYVRGYERFAAGEMNEGEHKDFLYKYRFSTLRYFHAELGLPDVR